MKRFVLLAALAATVVGTGVAAAPAEPTSALHFGVYGSKGSKTYHDRSECKTGSKIKYENLVQFGSEYEAQQKGRGHCLACLKIAAH